MKRSTTDAAALRAPWDPDAVPGATWRGCIACGSFIPPGIAKAADLFLQHERERAQRACQWRYVLAGVVLLAALELVAWLFLRAA